MRKKIMFVMVLVVTLCINFITFEVESADNLTYKLKENTIPIKTTKPGQDFGDLIDLKSFLKDKKIIGVGESTHGTADFFEMKHRIFEFLVEEMGYRTIVLEAQFGDGQIVNDYIVNGKGSLENCSDALKQFTVTSDETLYMIQWMKEFNEGKNKKNQIRFYGYDMQGIDGNLEEIKNYLLDVKSRVKLDKKNLELFTEPLYVGKDEERLKLSEDIEKINNDMNINKEKYIRETSSEEYYLTLQNFEIIDQWIDFIEIDNSTEAFNLRDNYATKNVQWILDYENKYYGNSSMMLWAHNGHIENLHGKIRLLEREKQTLGSHLKEIYGSKYYSIGFDFYSGGFVANNSNKDLSIFNLKRSKKNSFAHEMMKADIGIGYLDFNSLRQNSGLSNFLSSKIHINSIGADYNGSVSIQPKILKDSFDGIIFINTTKPAKFNSISLEDGNRSLLKSTIIKIIIILAILGLLFKKYKNLLPTIPKDRNLEFTDEIKSKIKNRKIRDGIIKLFFKLNNISSFKYNILAILFLVFLLRIDILSNSVNVLGGYSNNPISFILIELAIETLGKLVILLVIFIYPLKLILKKTKEKSITLKYIFISAGIGAILYSVINLVFVNVVMDSYLIEKNVGIIVFLFNIIINYIKGFIICYSYALFYTRWEKPIMNLIGIVFLSNILNLIINMIIFIYSII